MYRGPRPAARGAGARWQDFEMDADGRLID